MMPNSLALVFDIECDGLYHYAQNAWCITTKQVEGPESTLESFYGGKGSTPHTTIEKGLERLSEASTLIGHNIINYDLPVLKKLYNWEPKEDVEIIDTLVMSRLFDPDRTRPSGYTGKGGPHSLECWGYRVGKGKPDHEDWSVFSPAMLRRNREDVEINELVYLTLQRNLDDWDWGPALELEHQIAKIITDQEINGVLFDKKRAEECIKFLTKKMDDIDEDLLPSLPKTVNQRGATVLAPFTKTGVHTKKYREDISYCSGPFTRIDFENFDLGSVKQVKDYLLENGWKPESWNFSNKTGERTSPKLEGKFEGIEGDLPAKVRDRIQCRHRRSQIEGWIKLIREDGRITGGANPLGTPTARMRHSGIVNMPKAATDDDGHLVWNPDDQKVFFGTQMRSLFIARPNYKIVGHDAKGLELRMLAHFMNDPEYTEVLLNDDIHTFNQERAGLPTRDDAKTFIYAFIYGAGDAKLGAIVGGGKAAGAEIKRSFLHAIPSLKRLIDNTKRSAKKGYLIGVDGRKIFMRKDDFGKPMTHKALNTKLQCGGSLVMKQSSIILWNELLPQTKVKAYKVLDMHDESQAEVYYKHTDEYSELAMKSMVMAGEHFNLNVPMEADVKAGKNLAETH